MTASLEHLLIRLQKAAHYRQCATTLREMAQTAPSDITARQLVELAAQYDWLAEGFEASPVD